MRHNEELDMGHNEELDKLSWNKAERHFVGMKYFARSPLHSELDWGWQAKMDDNKM